MYESNDSQISFISYNNRRIIEVFPEQSPLYVASNLTVPGDVGSASVERIDEAAAIVVG